MMNGFSRREGICPISHNDLESLAESYMRTFNGSPWFDKWDIKTAYDRLHDLYRSSGSYGLAVWQEGEPSAQLWGSWRNISMETCSASSSFGQIPTIGERVWVGGFWKK